MKLIEAYEALNAENIAVLGEPDPVPAPVHSDAQPAIVAASVVHDLGNLIQLAMAAVNVVARTPDMPAVHSQPILGRATASLEQAGAIVRQSLDLLRNRRIAIAETRVAECLGEVEAVIDAMGDTGLLLEIEVEPDLPILWCDPIGLRRAVLNLVLNARDAIAGEGVVLVEARSIREGAAVTGVAISVSDNGKGMSPSTMARAFDPFFTTKADGLGGVGLPMVERLVRDAGGEIAVASQPGVGTTITLRLPTRRRTAKESLT